MDNIRQMDLNAWVREQQARSLKFGPKASKPFDARRKLMPQSIPTGPILPQPEMHAYVQGFRSVFRRQDTLRNAETYLLGLCSDLPHKNGETMEAAIPGARQMDIFNFLVRSKWEPGELDRERALQWVAERGHQGRPRLSMWCKSGRGAPSVEGLRHPVASPPRRADRVQARMAGVGPWTRR